jgi:UDP-N-acetylglucosamine 2-epimerase (non-hydrolysing)
MYKFHTITLDLQQPIMPKKKCIAVMGTRPEAIKMAPVVKALQANTFSMDVKVCVTAQHRQMLDSVLELFEIKPDFDLNIMEPRQDLEDITARILYRLKIVLRNEKPDLVLVHGDTTTTFATALTCFYEGIPVGHVEAGLRTGNMQSPWPEEMNRRVISTLATYHFAPTQNAYENLVKEGISPEHICVTGNTVIDALLMTVDTLKNDPLVKQEIEQRYTYLHPQKKMILVTAHRRENFGLAFENICHALKQIAERDDVELVYPVHLNPNVQEPVKTILQGIPNVHLLEPLDYVDFVYLMNRCYLVITDSGGIQEEAPALGKPVFVMRDTTERPEGIEAGTVKLVGTDQNRIMECVNNILDDENEYKSMSSAQNPYGDGKAAERILDFLSQNFPK